MGFIKVLVGLPIVLAVLVFAFVNNSMATFSLWPTGIEITVSLSVAIVFLVIIGYVIGWFFAWLSYAPVRCDLRNQKKQNKKLCKEQEKLAKEVEGLHGNLETLKAAVPAVAEEKKPAFKDRIKKVLGLTSKNAGE